MAWHAAALPLASGAPLEEAVGLVATAPFFLLSASGWACLANSTPKTATPARANSTMGLPTGVSRGLLGGSLGYLQIGREGAQLRPAEE
ncbi:MAG: hypothetical protein FRX49_12904 [Trebouxia sp. A1-2]|nr:MAG: hypothetical protein FRX49_12904 [Trebouxia sp. A1-2]